MINSVAIVGVGAMGGPMARRVHGAGFDLIVCDRDEKILDGFSSEGVKVTQKPSECSQADLVLILVATAAQVRDVVLGSDGITSGLIDGHEPLVGVMSTVGPEVVIQLQEELRPRGLRIVDVPISGGSHRAVKGTLAMMAGGDRGDVAAVTPVLKSMGTQILPCGDVGAAQAIKVLNNVLGGLNTLMAAELYRVAVKLGMNLTEITSVLEASTGRNWLSANPDEVNVSFAKFTDNRASFDSLMVIMKKDFELARELLAQDEGDYPVVHNAMEVLQSLGDETFENWQSVGRAPLI
ncbi:NAD(P)-dependent oxidoreductase [Rhodococcus sp. NPDC057529]|uniref:NAD(P)-dependent oxidoreductase n=1 Tax=Rhodococcus sp. NPDC057529 TaxID=3346158 RepID=UPI003670888D